MEQFANNVHRLLGLHGLTASRAAQKDLIGLSQQALSEIMGGKRSASLHSASRLSTFFEIPMERLLNAPFEDLLAEELSDRERYRKVEAKIPQSARDRTRSPAHR